MSMNNDESKQANMDDKTGATECGPGCDCDAPGLSKKVKVLVCLVLGLAAAAVLARGFVKKAEAESDGNQLSFATALPVVQAEDQSALPATNATEIAGKEETQSTLWGNPLKSLVSLNKVASEKDAVFVLLPAGSDEEVKDIEAQIGAAADKIISRGTTVAAFTLDKNTKDYAQVNSQVPAPCVLAMVKGRGMSVVAKDITEANLLQALVAASRASNCGPADAGCGPSGCE